MKKSPLAALIAAAFAACTTAPASKYAATDPKTVVALIRAPKQPYEVLGVVRDVETYYPPTSGASTLAIVGSETTQVLRQKAAALGANAVIVTDESFTDPVAADTMESTKMWLTGTAIRYTTPAAHP